MEVKQERRQRVLKFVKDVYNRERRVPTIREISDNVTGVTRSNIYTLFPGKISQICKEAGVDVPKNRIKSTKKASSTRKTKSESTFPDIVLSGQIAKELWVASTLEDKMPQDLMEEFLGEYRLFKNQYKLSSKNLGNFAKLLKDCENAGLNKDQIKSSMIRFINMGLNGLSPYSFNKLIDIRNLMIRSNIKIEELLVFFVTQLDLYKRGYNLCIKYMEEELNELLKEKLGMGVSDAFPFINSLKIKLQLRQPKKIVTNARSYRFIPTGNDGI